MKPLLLLVVFVAVTTAQSWTWAGIRNYVETGCTGEMDYTSLSLNVCWYNGFNETYPYSIAMCSGSSFNLLVCADAQCSECAEKQTSTVGQCQDDQEFETSSLVTCFDQQPPYPVYNAQLTFYTTPDCSGAPVAAQYDTFEVGCLPTAFGGYDLECVNGGATGVMCSDDQCSQDCHTIATEPYGCVKTSTGSQYYKCYPA